MKKILKWAASAVIVISLVQLIACEKDDGPPAKISFVATSSTVDEGDGTITIQVQTDRAASNDLTVSYTIDGTAQADDDYTTPGSFVIAKGQKVGQLTIEVIDDDIFDYDVDNEDAPNENIIITLSAVTGNGQLSEVLAGLTHTLTIEDNDDEPYIQIDLSWTDVATGNAGDVDMDLFLWYDNGSDWEFTGIASAQDGTAFEQLLLSSLFPDGTFGLTLLYYAGSSDNLTIKVDFTVFGGTLLTGQTTVSRTATYTLVNLNPDAYEEGGQVSIEMGYTKQGVSYPDISAITVPDELSRIRTQKLDLSKVKKGMVESRWKK